MRLELLTTQEERATLDAAAEKAGVRTGAFARDAALTVARAGVAGDRVIPLRVTAEQYRALVDYADRGDMEIEDAIRDNVLGQCYQCSEAAILDARERPLCERCRGD